MNKSPAIEIAFTDIHADGPLTEDHQLLLRIDAHLRITIDGRLWFDEPQFPVVELAAAAASWLRKGGDFVFETMEAEESPFMLVRQTMAGCTVGAAWQKYKEDRLLSCDHIRGSFSHFIGQVQAEVPRSLGVGVRHLIDGGSGTG
jgi:hypothetical protein